MGTEESSSTDLDLLAATLRADLSDVAAFVEGLAAKLEDMLPGLVRIDRNRQGFRGPKLVTKIALACSETERLELQRAGRDVKTLKARMSGGIVLKTEALDIDSWLAALTQAIAAAADRNERTRQALERLLME